LPATTGARETERGAHDLNETAALRRIRCRSLRRGGELSHEELAKFRSVLELGEAPPEEGTRPFGVVDLRVVVAMTVLVVVTMLVIVVVTMLVLVTVLVTGVVFQR